MRIWNKNGIYANEMTNATTNNKNMFKLVGPPGPILCPGKSCFRRLRMKDVLPTEY